MTDEVIFQLGSEVLQQSALHDFPWPENDPETISQTTAEWSTEFSALLDEAVKNTKFSFDRFVTETGSLPPHEQIWQLLTSGAFNFNGVEKVRAEPFWLDRLAKATTAGEQLSIAYPLICKINNPAKRLTRVDVTVGERAVVRFFRNLGGLVMRLYAPGIKFHILSDATLYNSALQVPPPSAYAYMQEFQALIMEENASDVVELHDYSELLAAHAREFETLYNCYYAEFARAPLKVESMGSLPTSVRTNANSVRFGLPYDQIRLLFGPRQVQFLPVRNEIDSQGLYALREQLAIKMACVDLDLPSRLWPNHVRATCHKGEKNNRPVLGLRPYPEYYGASRLLPYHGMPLIEPDKKLRSRLVVVPEVSLRGDDGLIRVLNKAGEPVLYCRSERPASRS
jgi:hypothetical protein